MPVLGKIPRNPLTNGEFPQLVQHAPRVLIAIMASPLGQPTGFLALIFAVGVIEPSGNYCLSLCIVLVLVTTMVGALVRYGPCLFKLRTYKRVRRAAGFRRNNETS